MTRLYVALERMKAWAQHCPDEDSPVKWIAPLCVFLMDEDTGYALDFDAAQDSSTRIPSAALQRTIARAAQWSSEAPDGYPRKAVIRCDRKLHEDLLYTLRKCRLSKSERKQIEFQPLDVRPSIVVRFMDSIFNKCAMALGVSTSGCDQCREEQLWSPHVRATLPTGPCRCEGIISVLDRCSKKEIAFKRLYAAAARFYRTKPWLHLRISHTMRMVVPALSKKPRFVTVIGGAGQCDLGLWVCDEWENVQHARFFDELGPNQVLRGLRVNFSTVPCESSLADLAFIEECNGDVEILDPDADLYSQSVYPVFCEVHMQFPGPMHSLGDEAYDRKLVYSQHIAKIEDLQWLYIGLHAAADALEKKLFLPVEGHASSGDFRVYHSFKDLPLALPKLLAKTNTDAFDAKVSFPPLEDPMDLPHDHRRTVGPPRPEGKEAEEAVAKALKQAKAEEGQQVLYEAMKLKATGNELYRRGQYEKALELYTRTLGAMPRIEEIKLKDEQWQFSYRNVLSNRAMALVKLKRWEEVLEDTDKVIDKHFLFCADIYTCRCLIAQGQAHEAMGKLLLAKEDYESLRMLDAESQFTTTVSAGLQRVFKSLFKKTTYVKWTKLKTAGEFGQHMFHTTVLHPNGNELVVYGGKDIGAFRHGYDAAEANVPNNVHLLSIGGKIHTWRKVECTGRPPSKRGIAFHTAVVYKRQMVVYGGEPGQTKTLAPHTRDDPLDDISLFALDLDTFVWSIIRPAENSPQRQVRRRVAHTAVMHGSTLYIFGGHNDSTQMDCFDFETKMWSVAPVEGKMVPKARSGHVAWTWKSKVVVLGGEYGKENSITSGYRSDMWLYDVKDKRWSKMKGSGPLNGCCETQAAVLGAGKTDVVVIMGGFLTSALGPNYSEFGMGIQQGKKEGSVIHRALAPEDTTTTPIPRAASSFTAVGNRLYAIGGYNALEQRVYSDVWSMKVLSKTK